MVYVQVIIIATLYILLCTDAWFKSQEDICMIYYTLLTAFLSFVCFLMKYRF